MVESKTWVRALGTLAILATTAFILCLVQAIGHDELNTWWYLAGIALVVDLVSLGVLGVLGQGHIQARGVHDLLVRPLTRREARELGEADNMPRTWAYRLNRFVAAPRDVDAFPAPKEDTRWLWVMFLMVLPTFLGPLLDLEFLGTGSSLAVAAFVPYAMHEQRRRRIEWYRNLPPIGPDLSMKP